MTTQSRLSGFLSRLRALIRRQRDGNPLLEYALVLAIFGVVVILGLIWSGIWNSQTCWDCNYPNLTGS